MVTIQLLNSAHRRDGFDCGDSALNEFLLRQSGQFQKRGFGKTYVATATDAVSAIGYVTVSAGQIATSSLPDQSKLPCYPVPILRIERLAVDTRHQASGIGQDLLTFALRLAINFSQKFNLFAVAVDAKHDKAKSFYVKLGFITCQDYPLCLYLPISTLEQVYP